MRCLLTICILGLASAPLAAAELRPCHEGPNLASAIAEPWEEATRTFANGAVRLAVIDTLEPAAAAFHLLILSPPYDELGDRQCRMVSFFEGSGYGAMTLDNMSADYDPAYGLTFEIWVQVYNPDTAHFDHGSLFITLNQSTGEITVEDIGS